MFAPRTLFATESLRYPFHQLAGLALYYSVQRTGVAVQRTPPPSHATMVRLAAYGASSSLLAGYVVLSAFRQRSNFFSAAVYLSKSNACMMVSERGAARSRAIYPCRRVLD